MNNESGRINDFTDLNSWQESHNLVLQIYKLSEKFPASEKFGLSSQIQRAVVSITSNIAEGFGRHSYKEKVQFYYLAHGSLTEVKNQLIIARDLGYINQIDFSKVIENLTTSQKLIQGLIKSSKKFIK